MLVGTNVLYFPAGAKDRDVTRYIAYLRSDAAAEPEAQRQRTTQAAELARRFMAMKLQVGRNLSELYGPLKQLRRDVAQLASAVPAWPDFAWSWHPDLGLMGMLAGLVSGPAGRAALPGHLDFPVPERLMSTQEFYDRVLHFLLALSPGDRQRPGGEAWFNMARDCAFAQFIVLHGTFGQRFLLQDNFRFGPGGEPAVTLALPAVVQSEFVAPELLLDIGLVLDRSTWPVPCTHGGPDGKPRDKNRSCAECIDANRKPAPTDDQKKVSEDIASVLHAFIIQPKRMLEQFRQVNVAMDNLPDAVFWLVGASKPTPEHKQNKATDAQRAVLAQAARDEVLAQAELAVLQELLKTN
jgi:hypothetical protein